MGTKKLLIKGGLFDEMNKREQEKMAAKKQLQRERAFNNNQYYDPFWGSSFGGYYGRGFYPIPIGPAGRYWRGNRFGWGIGYGHPFAW